MCGRFSHEDYLTFLADESECDIPYDPEPIGRFNVAPGTKVLLLSERDEQLHLDPVIWGYAPVGGINCLSLMHGLKLRPPAECLNHSGGMAAQFALQMDGLSGKWKATRNNHTLFTEQTVSQYLWQRSVAHLSNVEMKQKVSL